MEGEIKNLTNVSLSVIGALCYCYYFSSKLQKGAFRFISLLPILCFFTVVPVYLSTAFFRSVAAFFITWLANSKLLLFTFDEGPLSSSKSLPIFIASAALPIRMKQNANHAHKTTKKLPYLNLGTETLFSSILIGLLGNYRDQIHPRIVLILYCCLIFLLVDVLVALSSFLVRTIIGLDLEPPSDEPYLSTSLQEFWGRRWNLTVTNTLRETVYKPVRSISMTILGKKCAQIPALLSAFLVSGLMHELLFYYATRAKPSWEMTMFFVLQGICVVLEFLMKMALKGRKKLHLPWFVSGPLTVSFVVVTSFWLFFPPVVRNGADSMVLEEFNGFGVLVKKWIMRFSPQFLR